MAGLLCGITIMMIFSTVVYQSWDDLMHRENEEEMMFRAQELARGIYRFQQDHGGQGPPELRQLLEAGPRGQYYIRQLYDDPLVRDGKWGLLYQGPGGAIIDPSLTGTNPIEGVGIDLGLAEVQGQAQNLAVASGSEEGGAGLPIAGVKTLSDLTPFRIYRGLSSYSEWQFTAIDLQTGLAQAGGPTNPNQNPPTPSPP